MSGARLPIGGIKHRDRRGRRVDAMLRGGQIVCPSCFVPIAFETVTTIRFSIYGAKDHVTRVAKACPCQEARRHK